jgi:hypothetical protein
MSTYFLARNLLVHPYFSQVGPLSIATVSGGGLMVSEISSKVECRIVYARVPVILFPPANVVPQR